MANGLGPAALVDHIVDAHHEYLLEELPLVEVSAAKVRDAYRSRHPELERVAELVVEIRNGIEPHLAKEEQALFPAIKDLADGATTFPFGDISNPIRMMMVEHDRVGDLLRQLRTASGGYAFPEDGCTSYQLLSERLDALEADTHRHIHLENNILFPAVLG